MKEQKDQQNDIMHKDTNLDMTIEKREEKKGTLLMKTNHAGYFAYQI